MYNEEKYEEQKAREKRMELLSVAIANSYRANIKDYVKKYGLEYTEQVIKRVYKNHPRIRDAYLYHYNSLIRK